MTLGRFSFVTVSFETEFALLRLQARSMALFLPEEMCEEIVVLDNSNKGIDAEDRLSLLNEYGGLASRVRVLRPADVVRIPGSVGWRSQQVLKLCVAEQLRAERYVVLDAKNHFVRTPSVDFFVAPDGRSRVNAYGYEQHPHRRNLEHVLTYLGLDPSQYVQRFAATVTPFVLDRDLVRSMVDDVEQKSGRPFAEEFVAQELTEFFLYAGWVIASGRSLEDVFDFHQVFCPVVWPRLADRRGVEESVRQAHERKAPLFAVHRRAFVQLDADGGRTLARFWSDRGLFESTDAAQRFIHDFQQAFTRTERFKRLRELRYRALTVLRRARRRLSASRSLLRRA